MYEDGYTEPPEWQIDPDGIDHDDPEIVRKRWLLDLGPYLDGTFKPPIPDRGIVRDDGKAILYPGKWHTLIGPTASGKSWFGAQCVFDELNAGRTVLYLHFEESLPAGTVTRLLDLGLRKAEIRERFAWVDTNDRITRAEVVALAEAVKPSLVVLDGINAACSAYGWPVNETAAVGSYRNTLVAPFTAQGAAVLSLGHPPKAKDRQNERHGFGSTAWLDEVDGVGFRITSSKTAPIGRGKTGYSNISTVKDRYGQVEALGQLSEAAEGWYDVGSLRVDSDPVSIPAVRVRLLLVGETRSGRDVIDALADAITDYLTVNGPAFTSRGALELSLRGAGVTVKNGNTAIALERLRQRGLIDWPEVPEGRARPGSLIEIADETHPQGGAQ